MSDTRDIRAFEDWPGVLASLAAKGYVVASVEYRLSGEAPFPAAIQDIKAAIRWLRASAPQYGIDPAARGRLGGSAGGQLAALAATSCGAAALRPVTERRPSGERGNPQRGLARESPAGAAPPPAPGGRAVPRPEDSESDCVRV